MSKQARDGRSLVGAKRQTLRRSGWKWKTQTAKPGQKRARIAAAAARKVSIPRLRDFTFRRFCGPLSIWTSTTSPLPQQPSPASSLAIDCFYILRVIACVLQSLAKHNAHCCSCFIRLRFGYSERVTRFALLCLSSAYSLSTIGARASERQEQALWLAASSVIFADRQFYRTLLLLGCDFISGYP